MTTEEINLLVRELRELGFRMTRKASEMKELSCINVKVLPKTIVSKIMTLDVREIDLEMETKGLFKAVFSEDVHELVIFKTTYKGIERMILGDNQGYDYCRYAIEIVGV